MLLGFAAAGNAQEIVKVKPGEARASARPDDLFKLAPGQWHLAKSFWEGQAPCTPEQCEAGFTDGQIAVSVERAGEYVRITAGYRSCEAVGASEVEVGKKPGRPTFGRVRDQMKRVVKGVSKTCKFSAPSIPDLDVSQLFPPKQG